MNFSMTNGEDILYITNLSFIILG